MLWNCLTSYIIWRSRREGWRSLVTQNYTIVIHLFLPLFFKGLSSFMLESKITKRQYVLQIQRWFCHLIFHKNGTITVLPSNYLYINKVIQFQKYAWLTKIPKIVFSNFLSFFNCLCMRVCVLAWECDLAMQRFSEFIIAFICNLCVLFFNSLYNRVSDVNSIQNVFLRVFWSEFLNDFVFSKNTYCMPTISQPMQ